ncbi:hypothetical protein C3F09_03020 [candidate division GN15 bacterium]|uniref:Uncharacterized protein n=1 Tax=candidate division GN15 bacterium TaxID=2072418 RepID=A0A855XAR2_9BACT|nr:MAG: hypothetical protein C3F09_03020 [candidate division GN15 bacterium]
MKYFLVICVMALSAIGTTCNTESLDTGVIVPLEIGTVWEGVMVNKHADSTDSVVSSYAVTDTVSVGSEKWHVIQRIDGSKIRYTGACTNRKDGLWFTSFGTDSVTVSKYAMMYALYPANQNQIYQGMEVETRVRVCGLHDTVTVPAGTFECVSYCWDDAESMSRGVIYLAPGVGWVKEQLTDEFDRSRSTSWELVRIKKPRK